MEHGTGNTENQKSQKKIMNQKIRHFEDLEIWQESKGLAVEIYKNLRNCKDYGLRDQMQRSSVSVPSNIAEGFERNSNKEFIQYLYIAKGSCGELRTQIYIAREVGILDKLVADQLIEQTKKISSKIFKLIQTRQKNF